MAREEEAEYAEAQAQAQGVDLAFGAEVGIEAAPEDMVVVVKAVTVLAGPGRGCSTSSECDPSHPILGFRVR